MGLLQSLAVALGQPQLEQAEAKLNPELAAAVLLLAMERADFQESPDERSEIERLLASHFNLPPGELEELLERAEQEAGESVSFYDYVEHLNTELDYSGKCAVFQMLWRVAYADGRLDPFEEQLMRRLADMLYIAHADFVRLKLQVTGEL